MDKRREKNPSELAELDKRIEALQAERKAVFDAHRAEALKEVQATVKYFGFTATELGVSAGSHAKQPKELKPGTYRDPETGQTWIGDPSQRGRKPEWITKRKKDRSIESCRVDS